VSESRGGRLRKRQRIRLNASSYAQVGGICSVTIAVQARTPVFADRAVASSAVQVLREHATRTGVRIDAFCVMPDHVHIVLGPSVACDVITFVGQFKNLAQRAAWAQGVQGAFWQNRFWDRFLRAEEQLERVVEYVLNNPVRRGLVEHWKDYPFSGSLEFEL